MPYNIFLLFCAAKRPKFAKLSEVNLLLGVHFLRKSLGTLGSQELVYPSLKLCVCKCERFQSKTPWG